MPFSPLQDFFKNSFFFLTHFSLEIYLLTIAAPIPPWIHSYRVSLLCPPSDILWQFHSLNPSGFQRSPGGLWELDSLHLQDPKNLDVYLGSLRISLSYELVYLTPNPLGNKMSHPPPGLRKRHKPLCYLISSYWSDDLPPPGLQLGDSLLSLPSTTFVSLLLPLRARRWLSTPSPHNSHTPL